MSAHAQFPIHVVGHGPVRVVVAHGWMGDHTLYEDFFREIDQERFSYAFFDCRGYGTRRDEGGALTVEGIAQDVVVAADALGWSIFHVLGHSMGGMAAQRLMADHPGRLASVILLAPVPASGAKVADERRALLGEALVSPEVRRSLIDVNTGRVRDGEWLDRLLRMSLGGTSSNALESYMASWTGHGFQGDVEGSEVEVLVIVGALDPGASPDRISETLLSWYPNSRLTVLQNVGHYPMLEAPAELAAALAEHLGSGSVAADMI